MVVKVSQEVAEAIRVKRNYGFTNGKLLDMSQNNDFTTLNSECLNSNNISLTVLCEALYEGYEIEKPKYTEATIPKHFKFKHRYDEYTAKLIGNKYIVMWLNSNGDITATDYSPSIMIDNLNDGTWIVSKVISN